MTEQPTSRDVALNHIKMVHEQTLLELNKMVDTLSHEIRRAKDA
jgi:hypothetical protein